MLFWLLIVISFHFCFVFRVFPLLYVMRLSHPFFRVPLPLDNLIVVTGIRSFFLSPDCTLIIAFLVPSFELSLTGPPFDRLQEDLDALKLK